jgi:hypothetical protein
MRTTNPRVALVVGALCLVAACDGQKGSPTGPTGAVAGSTAPVVPAPSPTSDLSHLAGVWNVTMRLTHVSGGGCVAETMQAQLGLPSPYSLSVAQSGNNVGVTLTSASGEYSCAFTAVADSSGFTTFGQLGYFDCKNAVQEFRCGDGTVHRLFSWGQDVSGRVSGTEISGSWEAVWDDMGTGFGVGTKAQFSGSR